jgi:hypothetical protein
MLSSYDTNSLSLFIVRRPPVIEIPWSTVASPDELVLVLHRPLAVLGSESEPLQARKTAMQQLCIALTNTDLTEWSESGEWPPRAAHEASLLASFLPTLVKPITRKCGDSSEAVRLAAVQLVCLRFFPVSQQFLLALRRALLCSCSIPSR